MSVRASWFTLSRHSDSDSSSSSDSGTPDQGGGSDNDTITMTKAQHQAQINAIVADRLARQKAQFGDYDELKNKAAKLDEIEQNAKTELERERDARTKAEKAAAEVAATASKRLAAAELKAALTGITDNPADIVEDLDLSRYINEQGEVDADAVTRLRNKFVALAKPATGDGGSSGSGAANKPAGDIDQGRKGGDAPDFRAASKTELRAELDRMGVSRW